MGWKYTREILQEAVDSSLSVAGVLRHLGVAQTGGAHAHISRSIKRMGIDTSHYTGQAWSRGRRFPPRRAPGEWLRQMPPGSPRLSGKRLRVALLRTGRPYVCVECDNRGEWQGRPLTLHVDHVDGDYLDCRPEPPIPLPELPRADADLRGSEHGSRRFVGRHRGGRERPAEGRAAMPRESGTVTRNVVRPARFELALDRT